MECKVKTPPTSTAALPLVVARKSDGDVFPMGGDLTQSDTRTNTLREAPLGYRHVMQQLTPKFNTQCRQMQDNTGGI
jgi:hypothetical protein